MSSYDTPGEPRVTNYNANIKNVRAIVTSRWSKSGYTPKVIRRIESYYVDTSLDNDADPWQLEIGDPNAEYFDLLDRNNEARVQIFGVGSTIHSLPLLSGIADEITYGDDGIMRLTGRDFSSIAIDSTVPPGTYRKFQAWRLVDQQAREIGFQRTELAKNGPFGPIVKKLQVTDGSESYWEFWHRLYRKEQMWLWTRPDATLIAGKLNYESPIGYYFGSPRDTDSVRVSHSYIPVERFEIKSNKQQRLGEVWVYGHSGDKGFRVTDSDPTTKGWIHRPRKIIPDSNVHTPAAARKTLWEEIFETKVGAVEYAVTITDPGFPIQQNSIAFLNLKNPSISGEFFVVGVRTQVGADGFLQEIRLRERQYAISRRIPQDIKLTNAQQPSQGVADAGLSSGISAIADMQESWGGYFIKAANKWHGPWDYNLFLATLIGICDQETGFQNERQHGGPGGDSGIWEPPPNAPPVAGSHGETGGARGVLEAWKTRFANEAGDGYISWEAGVGPMQLTDRGLKRSADDLMQAGYQDEFQGGRWHPEFNIMIGAEYFRSCLQGMVGDTGTDDQIWQGVMAYNRGVGGAKAYLNTYGTISSYAQNVKAKVQGADGYLGQVKDAISAARDAANAQSGAAFDPGNAIPQSGFTNTASQLNNLFFVKKSDHTVDLEHVDYRLLSALNSLGTATGRLITVTSGYRYTGTPNDGAGAAPGGHDTQWYLWNRYKNSGFQLRYIAAKPGTSNHERGQACDCTVGGVKIARAFPASILAIYNLNCTVEGDDEHITLIGVSG